jgi:hypothetical protein
MSIGDLTEQALGNYATYAAYVAQTLEAEPTGTIQTIPNELQSVQADITILTDPARLEAFKTTIADQMNRQSGGPIFVDLSDRISDVQLNTTAQGAGTLVLSIIDPQWRLLNYDWPLGSGDTFIQADDTGYLWPPIDINFPTGTDCVWRLCQCAPVTMTPGDTTANMTLTFEDRSISWLREINATMGGVSQASPDATLGGFIKQLVDGANQYLRGHPAASGSDWQPIRLVELVSPQDPNYTAPVEAPSSASPQSAVSRQNPNKDKQGLTAAQQKYKDAAEAAKRDLGRILRMEALEGLPLNRGETLSQAESSFGGLRP